MDKITFINKVKEELNIELSNNQVKQFDDYYHLLITWNEKMNLTALTKEEDVYEKHFYDSLLSSKIYDFNNQVICDVGAGAGFPSIPLKIVYPNLKVTIVDSLNKRITFLNVLINELNLTNVDVIAARAEEFALEHREYYDLVIARAVARLNILDELCIPMVKVNGSFISLKGKQALDEIKEADQGIKKLNAKLVKYEKYYLFNDNDVRYLIKYDKFSKTNTKYPRMYAQIKKKPL
ncbi:MAG: 16S rRNA (guanine(527)-N(7))-methyltransferase RsmG [Bacilli bacterium]|jgi:16S rRNA (guanine527-N7)-methyltransferase|nr:16S rRNA (guanine(527)-N(7))-methyltransferase RsmG [Bacilli bacterium]